MPLRVLLLAALWLAAGYATSQAEDRRLTDDERLKLTAAVQAEGCSGGSMEADDDGFEVEDARCGDGRSYDLRFDSSFKLVDKQLDD